MSISSGALGASSSEVAERIRKDPWWFVETFLGGKCIFDKQRQILESLRDNKETYVKACHDSTKTWTAARAVLYWLYAYPNSSKVLTTAPTWSQIEDNLWREVRSAHEGAKFPLGGRLLKTEFDLAPQWFAKGQSSDRGVNIQGMHSENMLVIVDEADGVPAETWNALDGLLTSANSRLLAIGNPFDSSSEFKKRVDGVRSGRSKKVLTIAAEDVLPYCAQYPFLLQQSWVDDKKETWGETSSLYISRILAEWPEQGVDKLIPLSQLLHARGRSVERGILTYGADIARFGSNRTVRTLIAGNQFLWSKATAKEDTMESATRVIGDLQAYEPAMTQIDETGIGGAVVDRVRQVLKDRYVIVGVNNGGKASNEVKFANCGSEMWWNVRDSFERDQIGFTMDDPEAVDELINDLNRPTYAYNRREQLIVDKFGLPRGSNEYGLTTEERAAKSPDRGDSYVLAYTAAIPFIQQRRTTVTRTHSYMPKFAGGVRV